MAGEAHADTGSAQLGGELSFDVRRRSSRAEAVASAIEERVVSRGLGSGTRLGTRRELGELLGVAPSTVSEAIKLLEDRGRVTTRTGPGGGVFVAEPSLTLRLARSMMRVSGSHGEVAEALAVRDLLEPAVIEAAAGAAHPEDDLEGLHRAMRAMRAARETPDFYRRNLEFHAEVADLCPNDVLRTIYGALLDSVRARRPQLELLPGQDRRRVHAARVRAHQAIADAIVAGDVAAARSAADAHAATGPGAVTREE